MKEDGIMDAKNIGFDPFDWITRKSKTGQKSSFDVSITIQSSNKRESVAFIFHNGIYEKITDCYRIDVAPKKKRIYFRSNNETGYKLTVRDNTATMRFGSKNDVKVLRDYIGDYNLLFDEYWEMYFIQKEDK